MGFELQAWLVGGWVLIPEVEDMGHDGVSGSTSEHFDTVPNFEFHHLNM